MAWFMVSVGWELLLLNNFWFRVLHRDQNNQGNRGPVPKPVGGRLTIKVAASSPSLKEFIWFGSGASLQGICAQTCRAKVHLKNKWVTVSLSPQWGHFASTLRCRLLRFSPAGRASTTAFQRRSFVLGNRSSATLAFEEALGAGPTGFSGWSSESQGSDQIEYLLSMILARRDVGFVRIFQLSFASRASLKLSMSRKPRPPSFIDLRPAGSLKQVMV